MLTAQTGTFHRTTQPTPKVLGLLSEGFCPHHELPLTPNQMDAGECPKGCEWLLVSEGQLVRRLVVRPNGEHEWQNAIDEGPVVFYMHPAEWPCYPRGDGTTLDWPYGE